MNTIPVIDIAPFLDGTAKGSGCHFTHLTRM